MARRWIDAAELIATQGLKGRFVACSVRGLPFLLKEGMLVHFVPPTLYGPRHAYVTSVCHIGSGKYLLAFDVVQSRDEAECIVGSHCLVSRDFLPDDFDGHLHPKPQGVEGFVAQDTNLGSLGLIVEVREVPSQCLLVVDHDGAEILIPFVDEYVLGIDEEAKLVWVSAPQSLLNLNGSFEY